MQRADRDHPRIAVALIDKRIRFGISRGIKKTDLALDEWDKEITPSTELRKAFHGEVVDFATFREQYLAELAQHEQEGKRLADIAKKQPLTLLYAAKNTTQNHALVLADWLRSL